MFARQALRSAQATSPRFFSTSASANRAVAVLGASGGIGQPLSLLLKQNPLVTDLRLYDVRLAPGVAADISHVNTPSTTTGYQADQLGEALKDVEVIVIPAGVPRKPGMTRDDLFNTNASIVRDLAKKAAEVAPNAHLLIISNPVNSTVPIVAEVLKKKGVYDPKRLFGVTTLDVVRASTFIAEAAGKPTESLNYRIPVVGGHSGVTIVPLLSQSQPPISVGQDKIEQLTNRIQFGGDEVVKAKDGAGSATLSMAYAGARFAIAVLEAASGKALAHPEMGYVDLTADAAGAKEVTSVIGNDTAFFSVPLQLGPNGVEKILPLGKLNEYESELIKKAVADLNGNISKGVQFTANL